MCSIIRVKSPPPVVIGKIKCSVHLYSSPWLEIHSGKIYTPKYPKIPHILFDLPKAKNLTVPNIYTVFVAVKIEQFNSAAAVDCRVVCVFQGLDVKLGHLDP